MSQNEYEERKPIIYLAGIGMGQDDQLTGEVLDCLDRADAVMGARRMLDAAAPYTEGKAVLAAYKPSEMVNWLSSFQWDEAVLVLSGDTGFYSGAEAASKAFLQEGWEVEYIPGVSSLSYFCARLGRSWQNVHSISSHGRSCDVVSHIRHYEDCFILLGGKGSVSALCRELVSNGLGNVKIWAGENFSYETERILCEATPAELLMEEEKRPFGSLACVIVKNPHAEETRIYLTKHPKDEDFIRGKVPMTKETIRRLSIEKLYIGNHSVCYDIGAGTGSVSVEMGLAIRRSCNEGSVYAIEREPEALELIRANVQKFHGNWEDIHIVEGEAPEAFEGLPAPTHAFIGGSGGKMKEIIGTLLNLNPAVRIVFKPIFLHTCKDL
jgi:precorrin-6Y C5,15-methyltransferase (decarboxylating)